METSQYKIGIVGATGAVGQELVRLLIKRVFPASEIRLLASKRSVGREFHYEDFTGVVQEATPEAFDDLDVVIFSASGGISKELAPEAVKRGAVVIDNSSVFRLDEDVPLVIPEINAEVFKEHKGIVANPNCSTSIAMMGLYPLHREFGLKRFFASTYQAVSGSGTEAMEELEKQVKAYVADEPITSSVYPHQIAFNVLPHVDSFQENGYTREEMKMIDEGRKILGIPELRASTTCVRVPVMRAHSIAINAEFERPVEVEAAVRALTDFAGSEVIDDPEGPSYPMPLFYSEKVKCGVGRIRRDSAFENGLAFWIVGDQLWKGAALNAIQVAESMVEQGLLKGKVQTV